MRTARNRGGAGAVLFVVIGVAAFLLIFGLGQSFFGRQVGNQARRAAVGGICEDLAESTLVNALWQLSTGVNDPSSAFHRDFREGTAPFSFRIGGDVLVHARGCFERRKEWKLLDDAVEGRVLYQLPSSKDQARPYERFGTVELSCAVRHEPTGVTRRLSNCWGFKKALSTLVRPFDHLSFAVIEPSRLLSDGQAFNQGSVNGDLKKAVEQVEMYRKYLEDFEKKLAEAAEKCRKKNAGQAAAMCEQMGQKVTALLGNDWPRFKVLPPEQARDGEEGTLHFFPEPVVLTSAVAEMALEELALPVRCQAKWQEILRNERATKAAVEQLKAAQDAEDVDGMRAAFDPFLQAVRTSVWSYRSLAVEVVKPFQDRLIETGAADEREALVRSFSSFSGAEFARRSFLVLEKGDGYGVGDGRSMNEKLRHVLGTRFPAFSGVMSVLNGDEAIELRNLELKGRMLVYVDGDLVLENVKPADPERDMLAFVCRGQLTVDGKVQASLVSLGAFRNPDGATIEGSLILGKVAYDDLVELRNALTGRIKRDPHTASGPESAPGLPTGDWYRNYVTVAFGPEVVFKRIERN